MESRQQESAIETPARTRREIELEAAALLAVNVGQAKRPLREIAAELGISTRTLFGIRQQPEFETALRAAHRTALLGRLPEVLDAAVDAAIMGGEKDRRLYFELAGLLAGDGARVQIVNQNGGDASSALARLSPEDVLRFNPETGDPLRRHGATDADYEEN